MHGRGSNNANRTMIDVTRETLLTMNEAAARFGVTAKTIREWACPLDYKRRPKRRVLETVMLGGRLRTSLEAVQRFTNYQHVAPKVATHLMTTADSAAAGYAMLGISPR
jgi:hypothetical protein